jgi:glyoxylase-like metal-dependent hydrolase (beta-lactamase superfamily II)
MDDLLVGDAVGEVIYPKYRTVDGLKFPDELVFTVGGEVTQRMLTLTVQLNVNSDKSLFEPPEGVEPSQYPQPFVPQELASGVYFVPLFNGIGFPYNSMFVVFDDYVLVLDAPLSDLLSEFYIGLIKRVAPGKAIKYVVPTHHHSDHIGGIKRFVGEGATVVTTPGNKLFFEEVVQAPRTLRPTQRVLKEKLAFEIFEDSKVFRDDNHEVRLYDVGPNPHANEIVVAYLPKQKILYVTDMLWIHLADHYPPPRKTLVAFAKKIEELGLEIETIAPGHGKVGTAGGFA